MVTKNAFSQESGRDTVPSAYIITVLSATVVFLGSDFYDRVVDDTDIRLTNCETQLNSHQRLLDKIERDDANLKVSVEALNSWKQEHMRIMYDSLRETEGWRARIEKDIETMEAHIKNDVPFYPYKY